MPMIIFLPKHFAEVNSNPITFPESEDDMSTDTAIERERKIKYVDITPLEVEPEETLVFTSHSTKYPCFTIVFNDPDFARPGDKTEVEGEVRIVVAKAGETTYNVRHYKQKDKKDNPVEAGPFGVRSCVGGCSG
jgi:hypothetical protein